MKLDSIEWTNSSHAFVRPLITRNHQPVHAANEKIYQRKLAVLHENIECCSNVARKREREGVKLHTKWRISLTWVYTASDKFPQSFCLHITLFGLALNWYPWLDVVCMREWEARSMVEGSTQGARQKCRVWVGGGERSDSIIWKVWIPNRSKLESWPQGNIRRRQQWRGWIVRKCDYNHHERNDSYAK